MSQACTSTRSSERAVDALLDERGLVGKRRSGVQNRGALPSLSRCDCLHVLTTGPPRPTTADLMFRNDGVGGSNPSCGTRTRVFLAPAVTCGICRPFQILSGPKDGSKVGSI